ncbi:cell division protein FtsQ [Gillisia sp. Hel_I_86]|uniref:cell division protein FtsQ/DivIB n=1 Tax=Gillisia sp. Hel_I_86 TaxID=1249981 RepID=UPI0011998C20|nr:hypothetical protein [Gillisia sp. Hel_I_86]TVZ25678.1 cell division protein FtsQ [Gillisia sp. Hel_I_86]
MKINFNYIKGILLLALIIFFYGFAEKRNNDRKLEKVEVQFTQFENLYVSEESVNKLLIQNNIEVSSIAKETLDLNRVETLLNKHEMIENAEVFLTLDGILKTKISQRRPIGRVLGNNAFYLDRLGKKMPLSNRYSARVPVLVNVKEKDIKEAFPLVDYINKDQFLTEHITSITRLNKGVYQLELRKTGFDIFFGKVTRIDEKFNNFKAFYKKALKDSLINTYKMVDLQFGNQVVCTKK